MLVSPESNSMKLLPHHRLPIWLSEIRFDELLLILGLALFALLTR